MNQKYINSMIDRNYPFCLFVLICLYTNISIAGVFFASDHQRECIDGVKKRPRYDILKQNFRSTEPTFILYSNKSMISDEEYAVLPSYLTELEGCMKKYYAENEQTTDSVINALSIESFNNYLSTSARLYNREITYGEFHKTMQSENDKIKFKINQRDIEINNEIADSQEESDEAFRVQSQEGFRQIQRALNPPPTRNTTCYTFGNTVSCSTK